MDVLDPFDDQEAAEVLEEQRAAIGLDVFHVYLDLHIRQNGGEDITAAAEAARRDFPGVPGAFDDLLA